ncbi:MAG TPA: S24 family peptidase [Candidatus Udaeobacter sp.]|nr:S24 family peptidase [Candidatus Udaeobacter sp.]
MTSSSLLRAGTHAVARELAEEVLRRSGSLVLPASGRSMVPAIWPGDSLVVEPATSSSVAPGDIVLFSNAYRFVAHRVIEKPDDADRARVLTRGDAMATVDAPIRSGEILGKVSFIVRNGRCFEPEKSLRRSERALATLLRRSQTAARVIVGVHGLSRASLKTV